MVLRRRCQALKRLQGSGPVRPARQASSKPFSETSWSALAFTRKVDLGLEDVDD